MSTERFHVQAAFWRRMARAGARYGPRSFVRFAPPVIGAAFALALPRQRQRIRANLRRVLGPRPMWHETRDVMRTFMDYASCLAEALARPRDEATDARCHITNTARLRDVFDSRRGVILATAHVGPWDSAACLLAQHARAPVMVVMLREPDAGARALHDDVRRRAGVEVIHVGDDALAPLPLLRHLRQGGIVAIQLDRTPPGGRSVNVRLFDAPFEVPLGPFVLGAMAGVPVVPLFARRRGFFEYEFCPGSAIELPKRASRAELTRAAQAAAQEMEAFIRQNPTQWFDFEPPAEVALPRASGAAPK